MLRTKLEEEFKDLSPLAMKGSEGTRQNLLDRAGRADQMMDMEAKMKAYKEITDEANKIFGLDKSWKKPV